MKNIILLLFISNIAFAQTKGYILEQSDGLVQESLARHFFNANLSANANHTHDANNKTTTIQELGGWSMASGVVTTGSLQLDSVAVAIDAPDINIDATDDLFLSAGPASVSTVYLLDTGIVIENDNGIIKLVTLPTYADDAAAGVGGLVLNQVYKTATGELRIKL